MRQSHLFATATFMLAAIVMLIVSTPDRVAAKRLAVNRPRPLPLPSDLPVPLPDLPDLLTPDPTPSPTPTATPPALEARFSWSIAPRVGQYRRGRAFDATTRTYDPSYIYPAGWYVNFDACTSSGGDSPIRYYIWHIDGIDVEDFHHTMTVDTCRFNHAPPSTPPIPRPCVLNPDAPQCEDLDLDLEDWPEAPPSPPPFPQEGRYRVRLTVRNWNWGTASVTQEVEIKDWLIVSVGDSNASGEGNPNVPANWDLLHIDFSEIEVNDPIWEDPACNRSQISGPALAAELIEYDDPHTTVTLLSFACSGATVADIMEQIDTARTLICGDAGTCRADVQPVDALFISGGVNDLGFSSIIKACAAFDKDDLDGSLLDHIIPYERAVSACDDHLAGMVNGALFGLYSTYARLDEHITALGPDETYITEYPTRLFYNGDGEPDGCGLFDEISTEEAAWITDAGESLNYEIRAAAAAFGWNYVDGIASGFRGHGYCAGDPWFVELSDSLIDQLGIKGAIHPNEDGHRTTAEQIVASFFDPKPDRTPIRQVTITFEQVRVVNERTSTSGIELTTPVDPVLKANMVAYLEHLPREAFHQELTVTAGEWVDLPAAAYSTTRKVAAGDAVHIRSQTTLPAVYGLHPKTFEVFERKPAELLTINRTYDRDAGFGAGSHEETRTHSDGSITVRYRIDVAPIRPGQAPSFPAEQLDRAPQIER